MSLLDELLKKAEKKPDKVDIPPQLELIVSKRNKSPLIYAIFGIIIFTLFSWVILLASTKEKQKVFKEPAKISQVSEDRPVVEPVYSVVKSDQAPNRETVSPHIAGKEIQKKVSKEISNQKIFWGVGEETKLINKKTETQKALDSLESLLGSKTETPKQEPNPPITGNERAVKKRELLYMANTFELNGNYEEAIEYYERALMIDPSDYRIMNQIAYLYIKLGLPDRAIKYIERVKTFRPQYVPSMINLSVALMMKAEYEGAEEALLEVLRIEPFNKTALLNIAILYEKRGELEKAEEYYRRLLSTGDLRAKEGLKRIKLKKPLVDKDQDKED